MSPILGARGGLSAKAYGFTSAVAAGTSYESIATVTVGSGGASDITFSSIPSTFKHLQIRYIAKDNRSGYAADDFGMQFNGDTSTSSYAAHRLYGFGDGSAYADGFPTSSNIGAALGGFIGGATGQFGLGVIDIFDYTSTSKYKTTRVLSGTDNNGGSGTSSGQVGLSSGLWLSTSSINSIKLYGYNGSTLSQYSQAALYGIKGA